MKKERIAPPAVGGASLLVIFAVLCMTVFTMLALSTAQADQKQADNAAQAVSNYYAAELEAQKIYARLQAGEEAEGVEVEGNVYRFGCPVSEHQTLEVVLEKEGDAWRICSWQVVAQGEPLSETLPVWDGT